MGVLEPGTQVKTFRTDRDTLEQSWDMAGIVRWHDTEEEYETYFVTWTDFPGSMMLRDEFEPLTEEEKMTELARCVMET